ncbi:capsular polysaccharide biosynthesis protein [Aliamphritea ceti]|uniref:capsular polysaccharide biosynthesis protein n=1 Tax=Aliamphritea ceti TaxID=1524258 RepID=UPI0021C26389|nr:capsular polysaccharide biosynthesis protein [Aliamphritea ceti]
MIGFCKRKIGRLPHVALLLEKKPQRLLPWRRVRALSAILGWGAMALNSKEQRLAFKYGVPYIALEEGFLQPLTKDLKNQKLHSLIVDRQGIFYDATCCSDLECLIAQAGFSSAELARAKRGLVRLQEYKGLQAKESVTAMMARLSGNKPKVLIVDQEQGEVSIALGLANGDSFVTMFQTACQENPDADIIVLTPLGSIAGRKKSYLLQRAQEYGCTVVEQDATTTGLLSSVDKVYVVTSSLGFDGLLAGKDVFCFGVPFYAGWGLTHDQLSISRRSVSRSLAQVFAAVYFHYCHYINPYTGLQCEFEQALSLLHDQERQRARFSGRWLGIGFGYWKKGFVPYFLGDKSGIRFVKSCPPAIDSANEKLLVWASDGESIDGVGRYNPLLPLHFMEDGFIRSVGLGADAVNPLSLVIDDRGIYYNATEPSELESLLENGRFSEALVQRAAQLRQSLVQLKLSKYNVGEEKRLNIPKNRRIILVPGQVETDASIRTGSPSLKTNAELLFEVRRLNPDAYIIYKPHPDVVVGARLAEVNRDEMVGSYDLLVTDIAMPELLCDVDEVHTLTSLTGFEALLRGIKVYTYGMPFYAGWGITVDRHQSPRRTRQLTVDQLVAGTLILYPTYVDPESGDQINVETAVELINQQRQKPVRKTLNSWVWQKVRKPE